ncbi:MAG: PKD domain-containing protein, partial [Lewinella sp.]
SATDVTDFTVSPAPAANFSLSSSAVCTGGSITATNISGDDVEDFTFTVLDSDFNVVATSQESPATFTFGEDLPVGEYIVRLDVTSATCAPATNSARIKVGALPTIALIPQPDACGPGEVQLSATHSDPARINFINWQIRNEAGKLVYNSDAYVPPVANLLEGTYHVTATVANECGVVRSLDTFQLFEAPQPSFTVDTDVTCQGGTLTVTNTSEGDVTDFSFSLIDPMGTTVLTSSTSPATFSIGEALPDGEYTVRLSAGNPECAMATDEMSITVGGAPTIEVVAQPDFCGPTTVSLSAAHTGASQIGWSVTDAEGQIVFESNVEEAPMLNLSYGTYVVAATASSGCGTVTDRDTFQIFEAPAPSFTVSSNVVCQGGTLTVTNTSTGDITDFSFSLIDPTGTPVLTSDASPANFTIGEGLAKGTYTLRMTAGNPECGMETEEMAINIGGVPTVDVLAQPDFCGPSTVALSAAINGAKSVSWLVTNAAGATVFESNIPDGPTLNLEPGTYIVATTATSDCGTSIDRDTFRLYTEPVADIDLSATNLCLDGGNTVTVRNSTTGDDLSYLWTVSPAANVTIDDPNAAVPTFTFTGVGTYELHAEISNPTCDPITWTGSVTVKESVVPVLVNQDRFCEQVDLTPVVNYGGGAVDSVRWTFPGSVGDMTSRDRFPSGIPYRDAGSYVYELTVFNACGESTVADTIYIDAMPELAMGDRDTVCILDGLYVLPNPTPAGGTWVDTDGRTGVVTANGNFDPVAAGTGVTVLEYTYADGSCVVTDTREVFVIEEPEVAVSEPVLDACESDTYFVLSNGNPTGGWYEGPGVIDPSGVMDPSSLGAGTYTLTYYYRPAGMTCTGSVDFTVNVRPGPIAQIDAPDFVCIDEPVQFTQTGTGGVRYVWRNSDEPPVRTENPVFTFRTPGIHTVTLTAYNEFGCAHEVVKHVNVTGTPVARFEKEQDVACDDVPFTFYNNSQVFGEAVYFWDFGNGRTSNTENPAPVLFERGSVDTTYLVSLTVTNDCGTHTYSEEVTITTEPVAAFELSEEAGCSQLNVSFDNQTAGTRNKYKWFVNGELYSIDATPPARSFIAQGTENARFDIMLVAYNTCGSDTLTRTVISKPNELRVRFSADERTGCDPFTVQFRNFTKPDSLVSYAWDFGDGYSSDEKEPEHTFRNTTDAVKTYNVTLVADNGCVRDEITLPVTVYPAPDVSFEVASATCVGDSVYFRNTSGRVTDFVWTFGDGNTVKDVENPGHVFPGPGEYTVTLSATVEGADCPGVFTQKITIREAPQVDLTADNVVGCPPLQVDLKNLTESGSYYSWDFGDGNTAVGAEPRTHTYTTPGTYEITLTVRDESGCSNDAVFSSVEVHAVPEVEFAADASQACGVPQTVCFTNNTTGGTGYAWDFGNGLTSGLNTPCITYTEADTYNVTLKATNEYLCEASASAPLYIYGEPVAEFSIPDTAACTSGELPFTSESSNTDFIKWTFSDGYTSEEADFSRSFEEPGFYDLTVIAGNGSGCADTATFTDFVEIFPRPLADFDYDNAEGEAMNTIQFFDRSSADAVLFGWDFGDSYGSDEMDPLHRYVSGFDKTVYHWVENTYGCQDTVSKKVDLEMLVGLFVPNIFTPEDNTIEEQNVFKPKGIGLEDYYIAVYTRTGQLVWESESIDAEGSPTEAWDGTFQGRPAKPGTYVWRVHRAKFRNGRGWTGMANETGTIAKTGYITLLR